MTIYSHVTSNNISVTVCKIDEGWSIRTAPLTSQGAERELQDLLQRLDHVNLSQTTENQIWIDKNNLQSNSQAITCTTGSRLFASALSFAECIISGTR